MRKRMLSILFSILFCVAVLPCMIFAGGSSPKAYAVLDSHGTLTFFYNENKPADAYEVPNLAIGADYESVAWFEERDSIKKVVFDSSFQNYKPTSLSYWFTDCSNLTSIENVKYLNTSSVKEMGWTFWYCTSLTDLDLSSWNTSSLTNMSALFQSCENLKTLKVSSWDTSSVTNMSAVFSGCSSLTTLDLSSWNTSSVANMLAMFRDCSSLTTLKISSWDTSSVNDMGEMFSGCSSLTTLDLSSWNTSSVTNMNSMFSKCSSLSKLEISSWDISKVKYTSWMFSSCSSLTALNLSSWDTSNVVNMCNMFYDCSSLTTINLSSWDTSSVENMKSMFEECRSLTKLDLSSWDTSSVKDMSRVFEHSDKLTTIDLCGWDFSSVIYDEFTSYLGISRMFTECYALKTIYVDKNWNLSDLVTENSHDIFFACISLKGGAGTVFNDIYSDSSNWVVIDTSYAHIDGGSSNPGYFTLGYHLFFAGGDGVTGAVPETLVCAAGSKVKLPSASSLSKSGYKFIGWSDGNKTYSEGAEYEVGTSDVKFVAQWESVPTPTPTTNPGGNGSGTMVPVPTTKIPTPTSVPAQTPTGEAEKSVGEFVERCYNVCLGRSSDEEGFKYWVDMLNSGDSCGAEVGYGFVFSPEYILKNTSNEQFVKDMYSMFFGREADAEGFNSWVEQLNNGASRLQVYAGFASSPEFSNLCSVYGVIGVSILNDEAINKAGDIGKFVGRLYKICLTRYPDYCGFTAWTKGLQESSKTGSSCAYGFIFSGEFMSRGLGNEEFVVYMYKVFFDREADEAGYNLWLSVLNNGGSYEEVFNGFTGSPEFANLCASYGINA